jgi:hypothetical protein
MNWAYDDEGTYWQIYCDHTSYVLPRWVPEMIVRWITRMLRVVRPVR